jgi:stearoyl-CoA desaturase (delta-9 desaturase)
MNKQTKQRVNWLNTLFISLTAIAAVVGTPLFIIFGLVSWPTWVLAGSMAAITGLSITGGYHRLCAHKSYKASWLVRLFFSLFGAAAFEGSILEWCTDHRNHHRHTDTDQDPYNIKRGFWYAHIGWLFLLDTGKRNFDNVRDLESDALYQWQHRFYPLLSILVGFGLPTAIASFWGEPLSGLLIAGILRVTVVYQATFFINSICHLFGKQTYKSSSARDNWVTALVTFGEGFHNFHHQFPIDYRNGVRFFHFDPTKWLIYGLCCFGLTSNLKRVEQYSMIKYRIQIESSRLRHTTEEIAKSVSERIHQLLTLLEKLEEDYKKLKQSKIKEYQKKLLETRATLKATQRELNIFLSLWSKLLIEKKLEQIPL